MRPIDVRRLDRFDPGEQRLAKALARTRRTGRLDERGCVGSPRLEAAPDGRDASGRDEPRLELDHLRLRAALVRGDPRDDRGTEPSSDEALHGGARLRLEHEADVDTLEAQVLLDVRAR